jgi:pectate lyase
MNSNSTTPGSITYDGMTLASNLKIESSTNISFTTTNVATLTLVFANGFSGTIKINGTNYTANNGLVVAPNLPIATYTITKGSVANLYYMKTVYTDSLSTIDSSQNNQKLQIYPNPVHDILNIHVNLLNKQK